MIVDRSFENLDNNADNSALCMTLRGLLFAFIHKSKFYVSRLFIYVWKVVDLKKAVGDVR